MKTETHTSEGSVDHVGFFQISASSKQEPEFW
jgi:hypothetical protein